MYWINLIVFTILFCLAVYKTMKELDEITKTLSMILATMIAFLIFGYSSMAMPTEYDYQFSQEIVAMQDNQTYIVSRHSVNSKIKYYYMIKYNGGYISQNATQSNSIIYETNDKPEVKYYKERYKHKINRIIFGEYKNVIGSNKYEFYIPVGSIKQDFGIDLQ